MRAPGSTPHRLAVMLFAAGCGQLPVQPVDASAPQDLFTPPPDVAVDLPPPHITQISTGGTHVCAVDRARALWCWGSNLFGESDPEDREIVVLRPRRVIAGGVAQVNVGRALTCVLNTDSTVRCWGRNHLGQVDPLNPTPRVGPLPVNARDARRLVNGGEIGVAVQGSGELWAWGALFYAWAPRVLAIPPVRDARAGLRHLCAVTLTDAVHCAGAASLHELGVARNDPDTVAPPVPPASAVAVGAEFSCALLRDGAVWCWGANESGQLGRGTRTARELPARVEDIEGAQALLAGGATLFVRRDGAWLGLGDNRFGVFMHAEVLRAMRPTRALSGLRADATEVVVGEGHACALHADGSVACWGSNLHGALGRGSLGGYSVLPEVPRW
jgi:alpha-tubulin suppressor-like RCC1 family protein